MREASTGRAADLDLPAGEEREPLVGDVGVGERGEDVAGLRAPEADGGEVVGLLGERGAIDEVVAEPLAVGRTVRAAGDHAEVVVAEPHHGEVGAEAAVGVQDRGVDHLADRHVALCDAGALDAGEGAGALDVEDLERRQVDDAGGLAHPQVLGVDDRAPPARVPLVLARHHGVAVLLERGRRWTRTSAAAPSRRSRRRTRRASAGSRASARAAGCGPTRTARPGG